MLACGFIYLGSVFCFGGVCLFFLGGWVWCGSQCSCGSSERGAVYDCSSLDPNQVVLKDNHSVVSLISSVMWTGSENLE